MNPLEPLCIDCPYCGEPIEILVDCSVAEQEYIEDCAVCCRPISLNIICHDEEVNAEIRRDDEC